MFQGEKELVEDLSLVLKVFKVPMKQLGLITEEEIGLIFGNIEELVSVHQTIVHKLEALQNQIGVYDSISETVTEWVSRNYAVFLLFFVNKIIMLQKLIKCSPFCIRFVFCIKADDIFFILLNLNILFPQIPLLNCYSKYCSNQIYAKEVFDEISQKTAVADFLERCRASSFSRKLDLWSFLDTPRRRLPKVCSPPPPPPPPLCALNLRVWNSANSIVRSHCTFFSSRLYSVFNRGLYIIMRTNYVIRKRLIN